jgi:hypothetical protein
MIMDNELDRQLASLRASIAPLEPPEHVDRAIAAAIAKDPTSERTRPRRWRFALPGWLAASAALAATVVFVALISHDAVDPPALESGTLPPAGESDRAWFLPVVPVAELAQADDALVVSARLSRITLAQLGLPIDPAQAADVVDTELLVRPDGALLAVRFVR